MGHAWLLTLPAALSAEDRPSCVSDQSKSDFRPPRTPRSVSGHAASQPGTPMGHGDQFQVGVGSSCICYATPDGCRAD